MEVLPAEGLSHLWQLMLARDANGTHHDMLRCRILVEESHSRLDRARGKVSLWETHQRAAKESHKRATEVLFLPLKQPHSNFEVLRDDFCNSRHQLGSALPRIVYEAVRKQGEPCGCQVWVNLHSL